MLLTEGRAGAVLPAYYGPHTTAAARAARAAVTFFLSYPHLHKHLQVVNGAALHQRPQRFHRHWRAAVGARKHRAKLAAAQSAVPINSHIPARTQNVNIR